MIPWEIIHEFYAALGMELKIRFSLHDPENMGNYLGTQEVWEQLENQMRTVLDKQGVEYEEAVGEAAFYGPKFDFLINDAIGREWQVATIQLDFNMPERFNLFCINEAGGEERIAMIHVAVMGSIERFFSIFIEHFAGAFPLWLAPVQVAIVPIGEEQYEYATQVAEQLRTAEIRVEIRAEAETMQNRIRKAEQEKVPYMLIVGGREAEAGTVSVRGRGQQNLGTVPLDEFRQRVQAEVTAKAV
jgi:threonyl-tRNA synthetase